MGGLFGGGHKDAPVVQPTTLAAPPPMTPDAAKGQSAAQADALKRAQAASTSTLATDGDGSGSAADYSKATLG